MGPRDVERAEIFPRHQLRRHLFTDEPHSKSNFPLVHASQIPQNVKTASFILLLYLVMLPAHGLEKANFFFLASFRPTSGFLKQQTLLPFRAPPIRSPRPHSLAHNATLISQWRSEETATTDPSYSFCPSRLTTCVYS